MSNGAAGRKNVPSLSVVNVAELGRQMVAISFFDPPQAVAMISG